MDIQLKATRSLVPPTYYTLAALGPAQSSHSYYGLRHPSGIFAIRFTDVMNAYNSLASAVNNAQANGLLCSDAEIDGLRASTREFLLQLFAYFESGYEILLAFCSKTQRPQPGQPLHKWFTAVGYGVEVGPYFHALDPGMSRYRRFLNSLKHSTNRLSILQFLNPNGSEKVLGFYLEGADEQGTIAPVGELHPRFNGMSTAWSYNLHLRAFYGLIYSIAVELGASIHKLCARNRIEVSADSLPLVPTRLEDLAAKAFRNHAARFESAFRWRYPQEATEPAVTVELNLNDGSLRFRQAPSADEAIPLGRGWAIKFTSLGDGFSRSWSLPYFGSNVGDQKVAQPSPEHSSNGGGTTDLGPGG